MHFYLESRFLLLSVAIALPFASIFLRCCYALSNHPLSWGADASYLSIDGKLRNCKQKGFSLPSGLAKHKTVQKRKSINQCSVAKNVMLLVELNDGLWGHRPWQEKSTRELKFFLLWSLVFLTLNLSDFDNLHPVQYFHYRIGWIKLPPFSSKIWTIWFFVVVVLKKLAHQ